MSYTKEAIADTTSAIPSQVPVTMREPIEVSPYQSRAKPDSTSKVGQEIKDDKTKAEEPSQTADSVTLSPQVAALARKEQKFRQEQEKLKLERDALAAEKAELAQLKELKSKLAAEDYSALEGSVDYEKYTQYLLNKQAATTPEQEALKKLSDEVTGMKKASEEQLTKQFEAAVNDRKLAAIKLIETDPALNEFNSKIMKAMPTVKLSEVVVQHILDTWEHDSEELSVEQASKEVQEEITKKANAWASLIESTTPPAEEKKQLPPLKQGLKTITNQVTAGEVTRPVKSFQHMTDSERWAEARKRAEAKLQKQG